MTTEQETAVKTAISYYDSVYVYELPPSSGSPSCVVVYCQIWLGGECRIRVARIWPDGRVEGFRSPRRSRPVVREARTAGRLVHMYSRPLGQSRRLAPAALRSGV